MATTTYLATVQQIKNLTPISNNVELKHINATLTTTQVLKVKPLLGEVFMNELLAQIASEITILGASAANPVEVSTDGNHGYATGDSIFIDNATGMTGINGQWTITVTGATTFELDGLDGTLFPAYNTATATAINMPAVNVLLMPMVRQSYAWWVLRDAMPWIWMHVTNSTLMVQGTGRGGGIGGEGGTTATVKDMQWMQKSAQDVAEAMSNDMLKFLGCNSKDYPTWRPTCTSIDFIENDRDGHITVRRSAWKNAVRGA